MAHVWRLVSRAVRISDSRWWRSSESDEGGMGPRSLSCAWMVIDGVLGRGNVDIGGLCIGGWSAAIDEFLGVELRPFLGSQAGVF